MTTYATIANGDIDQDSAITQTLMTAMRDNPIAITEGATNAPRIQLAALPRLVVGDVVVCEDLIEYSVNSGGTLITQEIGWLQKGTVRLKYLQRASGGTCTVNVDRKRRGSTVNVSSLGTASVTNVARSVDIAVQSGDFWTVSLLASGAPTVYMDDFQLCTSGDLIYPGAYMPVVAW